MTTWLRGGPFLGVCLGLQLLLDHTEEGDAECIGAVAGSVKRLPTGLKVPHMGWNSVHFRRQHPVFDGIPDGSHFYFVHSYYASPDDDESVAGVTDYGVPFCSITQTKTWSPPNFTQRKAGGLGCRCTRISSISPRLQPPLKYPHPDPLIPGEESFPLYRGQPMDYGSYTVY